MDPNTTENPATWTLIIGAIVTGLGYVAQRFLNRDKQHSADGADIAQDNVVRTAGVTASEALTMIQAVNTTLQAQITDMNQRFQVVLDSRDAANAKVEKLQIDVADLKNQLGAALAMNTKLTNRVKILEGQVLAAGLALPPDNY